MNQKFWTETRIRKLRDRLGLSQTQAADAIEVSKSYWHNLESGRRKPNRQVALLLFLLQDGALPRDERKANPNGGEK